MSETPKTWGIGKFSWLHFSDLHVGVNTQDWLWPAFKHKLYQDLENLHSRIGDWDTVIFSGDLTQRGTRDEFDRLDVLLEELWNQFDRFGFSPSLFVLPGNHDISRPKELSPELRVLKRWWDEPEIHDEFFASSVSADMTGARSRSPNAARRMRTTKACKPPVHDIVNVYLSPRLPSAL